MRFSQPTSDGQPFIYSHIKINGCAESIVGFDLLNEAPSISKRRYCNKTLVTECITVPEVAPLDLASAQFIATDDPCYGHLVFDKRTSGTSPKVSLQLNATPETIGILVDFDAAETCGLPPRMAYKLYGTITGGGNMLLAQGNIYITPCRCPGSTYATQMFMPAIYSISGQTATLTKS